MQSIRKLKNLKGKRVLLRADFNVPVAEGKVIDPFRINKTLPTIDLLKQRGAVIIIVSHLGSDGSQSLKPVADFLNKKIPTVFSPETLLSSAASKKLLPGSVTLLENIRRENGEKKNDISFAKKLAAMADLYVNDAFSVSHRAHASVVGVPKYLPSYAGLQLEQEVHNLSLALKPKHPFVFIIGGAKFETKLPMIKKYLQSADTIFIGGALANNFLKDSGFPVGTSLIDTDAPNFKSLLKNKKIVIPKDVVVMRDGKEKNVLPSEVRANEMIIDVGEQTILDLKSTILKAKMILWNGPLGKGEHIGATKKLLQMVAKSSASRRTQSIIGGGDTVEVISKLKMEKKFTFVSTGGGATIEFLTKGTLPGIKALK